MADTWPPIPWLWAQYRENGAWYSGDPTRLSADTRGFWKTAECAKVHVPLAADLASMAAGFLFCGSPTITHDNEETSKRAQEIADRNALYSKLLQAVELQTALGGVFLKWNWDTARAGYPLLRIVPADAGLPYYVNGLLDSVRFWAVVKTTADGGTIWRLEERYTSDGRITSKLFEGSANDLGREHSLADLPETAGINPEANSGTGMLLATYVPARLPNRLKPYEPYGRSDYEGLHTLFSALDEAYSSMLRDIRLGKTQIIVPAEFLEKSVRDLMFATATSDPNAIKWTYNKSDEAYVALNIDPENKSATITTFQPSIRAEEHQKAIDDIVRRILTLAGYAPQSGGLDIEGRAESGTALNVRERRSMQTAETKKTYWWHALLDIVRAGLALDKAVFTRELVLDGELTVEFADNTQPDMQTLADTLDKLERAGAVSTETKVRLLHPDWDDGQVAEEIARIREERGLITEGEPDAVLGDMETDPPGGD